MRLCVACRAEKADAAAGAGRRFMRYVIGVCMVAGFLIWDAGYNEGRYISYTVKELKRLTAMVGA
jgi:hypothetical protein